MLDIDKVGKAILFLFGLFLLVAITGVDTNPERLKQRCAKCDGPLGPYPLRLARTREHTVVCWKCAAKFYSVAFAGAVIVSFLIILLSGK